MLVDPRWQQQLDDIAPEPNAMQRALIQAKAAIEQYGWVQGWFGNATHGFCMIGAIEHALPARLDRLDAIGSTQAAYEAIYVVLAAREPQAFKSRAKAIGDWNDDPSRTQQEVLDAFDAAIAAAAGHPE